MEVNHGNKRKKRKLKKGNIFSLICMLVYIIFLIQFFKLGVIPFNIIVFVVMAIFTMLLIDGFLLINVNIYLKSV